MYPNQTVEVCLSGGVWRCWVHDRVLVHPVREVVLLLRELVRRLLVLLVRLLLLWLQLQRLPLRWRWHMVLPL